MNNEIDELFVAVSRHVALRRLEAPSNPPVLRGRYELHAVVGSGSFGVVYRAWDLVLERFVALKRGIAIDLGEARALAAVRHPNVVTVFDVAREGDIVELAMEYLDGSNLTHWSRERSDDATSMLTLLEKAADGLAAIHRARLVHADIKPSNIMVVDGEPILIDLGLAGAGRGGAAKYMAPEVWIGQAPDAKSDQYSFCLAAREVLGSRMSRRSTRVIDRGLSHDPSDRWRDMDDLAVALHAVSRPRWKWLIAGLTLIALVVTFRGPLGRVASPLGASPAGQVDVGDLGASHLRTCAQLNSVGESCGGNKTRSPARHGSD